MTLRMSRVSCVREVPTWPCFITKDLGTLSRDDVEDCVPFKWVRFLRLRAMDQSTGPERRVLKYSVIQSPDYLIYLQRRKKKEKRQVLATLERRHRHGNQSGMG
jgi:hypothetical protein